MRVSYLHPRCGKVTRKQTHFANRVKDVLIVCNVSRVKGDVVVSLDDVKDRDDVATSDELFDDVSTDEPAPTDDQVDVFVLGRHYCRCSCYPVLVSRHSHFSFSGTRVNQVDIFG